MSYFIGGFIRCVGTLPNGGTCDKLHTVDGAVSTPSERGCPSCGHDIKRQAWTQGQTQYTTHERR